MQVNARVGAYPTGQSATQARERRPPVGTAARRLAGGSLTLALTGYREGNAGVHTGTAAHRAASARTPTVAMAPVSAGTSPAEMTRRRSRAVGLYRGWRSFPSPAFGGLCRPEGRPSSPGGGSLAAGTTVLRRRSASPHFHAGRSVQEDPIMRVSPGGGSSLARLVSRAPRPHRENWRPRRSLGFHHRPLSCRGG